MKKQAFLLNVYPLLRRYKKCAQQKCSKQLCTYIYS